MERKIKFGKIAIVTFITILIWVWADLALDEELTVYQATIRAVNSNPKFWVSFPDTLSFPIDEMVVKGPHRRITELKKDLEKKGQFEIDFDAATEKMTKPGTHSQPLLPLLQKAKEIKRFGLKAYSCKPDTLDFKIVGIVKKTVAVQCFDENGLPLKAESIEPAQVDALVPDDVTITAKVTLNSKQIKQATEPNGINIKPYIERSTGQRDKAAETVNIKMPLEAERLRNFTIKAPTLSIALSPPMLGRIQTGEYKLEVTNLTQVLSPITIKATDEAKLAYEKQFPKMTLYIMDEDKDKTGEQTKVVVYNFPQDSLQRKEIELVGSPAIAQFKITLISSAETPKPPG